MMACVNDLYKIKEQDKYSSEQWQFALESIVQLVAPFAPHVAEELWHQLGHEDSVHIDHWPELDKQYLKADTVTIAVQVNGKVRGTVEVNFEDDEETVIETAKKQENVQTHTKGKDIVKSIYVKGRLVNFVVK